MSPVLRLACRPPVVPPFPGGVEGVFPGMQVGLVFVKDGRFRDVGRKYGKLSLTPGQTMRLGDVASKPYP